MSTTDHAQRIVELIATASTHHQAACRIAADAIEDAAYRVAAALPGYDHTAVAHELDILARYVATLPEVPESDVETGSDVPSWTILDRDGDPIVVEASGGIGAVIVIPMPRSPAVVDLDPGQCRTLAAILLHRADQGVGNAQQGAGD